MRGGRSSLHCMEHIYIRDAIYGSERVHARSDVQFCGEWEGSVRIYIGRLRVRHSDRSDRLYTDRAGFATHPSRRMSEVPPCRHATNHETR